MLGASCCSLTWRCPTQKPTRALVCGQVLVLLDLSYISRFWTQCEMWLSMQHFTSSGLHPSPTDERRCRVVPILVGANQILVEAVTAMWAERTPEEACKLLEQDDVLVTNKSDKAMQVACLLPNKEGRVTWALGMDMCMDPTTPPAIFVA